MKSPFKLSRDILPLPVKPAGFLSAPIGGEDAQVVTYLNHHPMAAKHAALNRMMQRLDPGRFAQGARNALPIGNSDPYILLLLADQELDEGREEQARYLVEAAYEAYDQPNESWAYRIGPAD